MNFQEAMKAHCGAAHRAAGEPLVCAHRGGHGMLSAENQQLGLVGLNHPHLHDNSLFNGSWDLPTKRYFIGDVGGNDPGTAVEEAS